MTSEMSRLIDSCAEPARWAGVRAVRRVHQWPGIQFDYGREARIELLDARLDLGTYPAIRFHVEQPTTSEDELLLVVESNNGKTAGFDG